MMLDNLRGQLKYDHVLAPYTSWKIGGPAKIFYQPADLADLQLFLRNNSRDAISRVFWLGLGSNVLIRDGGIDGIVICVRDRLDKIEHRRDAINRVCTLRAEAGTPCGKLAKYCLNQQLVGGEFWAGIPGTVGGALTMNAGAFGSETWDRVVAVETINKFGEIFTTSSRDAINRVFNVGYRKVDLPTDQWFLAGHFAFTRGDAISASNKIRKLMTERAANQPLGEPSCGSVFRNPPDEHAARLIEACGLKGRRVGDAEVSTKHANFIVNKGKASAKDVELLINEIKNKVQQQFAIELQLEVKIVGVN